MFCLLLAQSSGSEYYSCWYPLQFYVVRQLWPVSEVDGICLAENTASRRVLELPPLHKDS